MFYTVLKLAGAQLVNVFFVYIGRAPSHGVHMQVTTAILLILLNDMQNIHFITSLWRQVLMEEEGTY